MFLNFCYGFFLAYNAAYLGYFSYCLVEVLKLEYKIRKEEKRSPM